MSTLTVEEVKSLFVKRRIEREAQARMSAYANYMADDLMNKARKTISRQRLVMVVAGVVMASIMGKIVQAGLL